MSPREESNLDQRLRRPQFYPLNYRGQEERVESEDQNIRETPHGQ